MNGVPRMRYGVVPSPQGTSSPLGWDLLQFIHTGQSLATGVNGTPVLSTVESWRQLAVNDSSGVYDITQPLAPTLSLVPSVAPVRTLGNGSEGYPLNLSGEIADSRISDQMAALAAANNRPSPITVQTCIGYPGAAMSQIDKGGNVNSYPAGIFETQVANRLARASGKKHGVAALFLTHGETDAVNQVSRASYASLVQTLQQNYQQDCAAITGQTWSIPMIASQQTSLPASGEGVNTTAPALLDAAASAPGLIVVSGPKYNYVYSDNIHLFNTSYRLLGEKYAQVLWTILTGGTWLPLQPTSFSVSVAAVTVSFNVPFGTLVFDSIQAAPHQSGQFAAWAAGNGFEIEDTFIPGQPTAVSNTSPIQITWPSHGRSTGDVINIRLLQMSSPSAYNLVNGTWTITVVDGNNFTLNSSTAPGGTFAPGTGISAIGGKLVTITGATIAGNAVKLSLSRPLSAGAVLAYAMTSDFPYGNTSSNGSGNCGGFQGGFGRCGLLRDSDPFTGISGINQPNWCCAFSTTIT
jgi:Carbohydrate esterase, sialic acid-specific acetylesterase